MGSFFGLIPLKAYTARDSSIPQHMENIIFASGYIQYQNITFTLHGNAW